MHQIECFIFFFVNFSKTMRTIMKILRVFYRFEIKTF